MAEIVNANTELLYFSWIMNHPEQFSKVESGFFKKDEIRFVYEIIREEYLRSVKKIIPSPNQVYNMVKLQDTEGKINKNILMSILKDNTSDVEESWLEPRFKAWKLSNTAKNRVLSGVEMLRDMEDVNYENVVSMASTLKDLFSTIMMVDDDDDDLGSNFYDPESHKQNVKLNKIPSGWSSMDRLLGGGWDLSTLNVIMGETNIGKSMWLHNIGSNAVKAGFNVVLITLEMASYKCVKRMGSMLLNIPPSLYEEKSQDTQYIQNKINAFKSSAGTNDLFNNKAGELWIKKFNTSDCTITDLDNYLTKIRDRKNFKIDMVLIDYLNIMSIEKGLEIRSNLYQKGKHLAEGLRYLGDKHNCAIITATQTDRTVWGASDIKMDSVPESKAIVETADTVWGIIRTPDMKKQNLYRLKNLKLRDGECKDDQITFNFKPESLTMENDHIVSI
jgi:replicative DNA helicase